FAESWYGREDIRLTDKLLAEMPSILLWAIEGWRRLRDRGHFVQPDTGAELVEELEELSSPVAAFIEERCVVGPNFFVSIDVLFSVWRSWCEESGRREPGTKQTFSRDLRAALPALRRGRPREGGQRGYVYYGIEPQINPTEMR